MKISKQAQREARQLFRSCQVNGLLDENRVRQAVSLLLAQKPRGYVGILSRLHRLVKLDLEQHAARVESATPLPADLQADVARPDQKNLRRRRGHFVQPESGADWRAADSGRQRPLRRQREDAAGKIGAKFLTEFYEQLIAGN